MHFSWPILSPSMIAIMDEIGQRLQSFIRLLRTLVREPSFVGVEDAFFRVLRRELDEFPVELTRYHGLLVVQGNRPRERPGSLGRTELGHLMAAADVGVSGTTLQLPTSSYDTHQETVTLDSCDAALRLLCDLTGLSLD